MSLGAGYRYLMSSVARHDEAGPHTGLTAYYAAHGTPPGRYLGAGLAGLGDGTRTIRPGDHVSEEGLWRMLGMLQDPFTGQPLGRTPAGLNGILIGPDGTTRPAPKAVAGFDLTFSVPKSVSTVWALAGDDTKAVIHAAHRRALEHVIGYAERHVFATRAGKGGAISLDVRGVVAAAFDHWDSRAGDPQLHTHVVVLNRVQATGDQVWRTLDSKTLFRHTVALSELYNGLLQDELTTALGWEWTPETRPRGNEPVWEVTGVPKALREEFSQRSAAINTTSDALIDGFVATRGRRPTSPELLRIRQHATLATRPDKQVHSLHELTHAWRERATAYLDADGPAWVATLTPTSRSQALDAASMGAGMKRDIARLVLAEVADTRATFTRANLLAETHRQLRAAHFTTAAARIQVGEEIATLAADQAVQLTPDQRPALPEALLRPDGSSRLRARNSDIYSTHDILAAESRLLDAGRATTGPAIPATTAREATTRRLPGNGRIPTFEQADAVTEIVTSGRVLDVLVGAAGTGKSTTMAAVRAAWEGQYGTGSVIGLAPSAAAAQVLADAVGIPTENTTKWILENQRNPVRRERLDSYRARLRHIGPGPSATALRAAAQAELVEYRRWALRPGQLVIIDEASMAATRDLDHITTAAARAGAKVLLVGDWAQLSPVQAGGAFKMLADDRTHTPHLSGVHRFHHPWEQQATLRLRAGDPGVIDTYIRNGRITGGHREPLLDAMFAAWRTDTDAGKTSLMLAPDAATVTQLNDRARAHRIALGEVTGPSVRTDDGTTIAAGDVITTRLNQRTLNAGRGWVRNGDTWTVAAVHPDGSLDATDRFGTRTHLPAQYVREHVELGYATTAYRAQGRTVDTAHAYLNPGTTREPLYVMATRGRQNNRIYVDINPGGDDGHRHHDQPDLTAAQVLAGALANPGHDTSAHETRAAETRRARLRELEWERRYAVPPMTPRGIGR